MRRKIKYITLLWIPVFLVFVTCEPDHETIDVSAISELPKFNYLGGQFISFEKGSLVTYVDPGVIATVGDEEVDVLYEVPVAIDVNQAGAYVIYYYAQNEEHLVSRGRRIISVTNGDVSDNDLSGDYIINIWEPVEVKVKKLNDQGWYSCSDVLGYPGVETKGEFVDIGNNQLYLLPGESDFSEYWFSEGTYSFTTLSWDISFIEDPYYGIEIPVTLIKIDE